MKKRIFAIVIVLMFALTFGIKYINSNHFDRGSVEEKTDNTFDEESEEGRFDRPNEFAKFHQLIRTKDGDSSPDYSFNNKLSELAKAKSNNLLNQSRIEALNWEERGPSNVPGRTRGIIVFPSDPALNTWLAGTVGGGIWKTNDAGNSWQNMTPDLPNLSTTTLVMSESNNDIIYAGTGELFAGYNSVNGDGILKSIDGGTTWTQLESSANNDDFRTVNRLIVSPSDPNIVVVAASNSYWGGYGSQSTIMRSTDGGISWTKVYEQDLNIEHIVAAPSDFNIQYASVNSGGIIKSIDAGLTWTTKSNGINTLGRMEIAVSHSNPNKVFVSSEGLQTDPDSETIGSDLYLSLDGGDSWALVTNNTGLNPDFLGGQGFYDNTIAVHPYNDDIVYTGGVDLYKFTLTGDITEGDLKVLGAQEKGTEAFMDFVIFTESNFSNGSVAVLTNEGVNITSNEFVSIELRFGNGLTQKAHRFTVPEGATSGVQISDYSYVDYVDVPFEVWDITNNKQLMVSFRDQERDGKFNLNDGTEADRAISREYLFINNEDYSPTTPHPDIAKSGGRAHRQMYFFWPLLAEGAVWDPNALPDSKLTMYFGAELRAQRNSTIVSDAYDNFGGPNPFTQSVDHSNVTGPHPDHHNLVLVKVDETNATFKILNANDGGIYYSNISTSPGEASGTWKFAGNGLNTTQFYGIDKKKGEDEYLGGTQDNGTWLSAKNESASQSTKYMRTIGGDGFEVAWNYNDPNKLVGSLYNNRILKSVDGGVNWSNAVTGLGNVAEDNSPFITKIANNKSDPDVLYAVGSSGVWKSSNFASSWTTKPISDEKWNFSGFADVDISIANNEIVWAGGGMSDTRSLFVSRDKGETFSITNNFERPLGVITGMASHPYEEETFYALFSFAKNSKVLRTKDLGNSWEDISGFGISGETSDNGFPDVAVYCLLVRPDDANIIWVGTEIGLFESTDAGITWHFTNNGLPAVSIWDMKVVDDQIVVGTHGRGIWSVDIPELVYNQNYVISTSYKGQQKLEVELDIKSNFDKIEIYIDNILAETVPNVIAGKQTIQLTKTTEGKSTVFVRAFSGANSFDSPKSSTSNISFAPILNTVTSTIPGELNFNIGVKENYSSLEILLDGNLVSNVESVPLGNIDIMLSGLENKLYDAQVVGIIDGVRYSSQIISGNVIASLLIDKIKESINVYPNPADDFITINFGDNINQSKNYGLHIYNTNGQLVDKMVKVKKGFLNTVVNIEELNEGIYFIRLHQNNVNQITRLIVSR